jgi:pimeloyl-ACP methyl ester carboxylesterase
MCSRRSPRVCANDSRYSPLNCPRLSQREAPVRAIEQADAELFLKARDRLTERRLRHAEATGRTARAGRRRRQGSGEDGEAPYHEHIKIELVDYRPHMDPPLGSMEVDTEGAAMRLRHLGLVAVLGAAALSCQSATAEIVRRDFTVTSADGFKIFVREVRDTAASSDRGPMLLINGGRPGVLASWDVNAPASSTAEELAKAGHHLYLMDVRGFGRSQFPVEMTDGRFEAPVAVRSNEAVRDVAAVVGEIKRENADDNRLAAMGWATGSQWLGHYASLYPDQISHLIYYNGAYGGPGGGWRLQNEFGDPERPAELDYRRLGAYQLASADDLAARWRQDGIDSTFLDRYAALAMEGDKTANERDPPSFKYPSGPFEDTLKMVNGWQIFDASFIRSHVLILRSGNDFWSRPIDGHTLLAHLTHAASPSSLSCRAPPTMCISNRRRNGKSFWMPFSHSRPRWPKAPR